MVLFCFVFYIWIRASYSCYLSQSQIRGSLNYYSLIWMTENVHRHVYNYELTVKEHWPNRGKVCVMQETLPRLVSGNANQAVSSVQVDLCGFWSVQAFISRTDTISTSCRFVSFSHSAPAINTLRRRPGFSPSFRWFPRFPLLLSSNPRFKLPERLMLPFSDAWVGSTEESQAVD